MASTTSVTATASPISPTSVSSNFDPLSPSFKKITTFSAISPGVRQRVLPLLCYELLSKSQPFQHLNLLTFEEWIPKLAQVEVYGEDVELLLAVLFKLLQRQEGLTNFQIGQNRLVAENALRILHTLFTSPQLRFSLFVSSLKSLLLKMNITEDTYYQYRCGGYSGPMTAKDLPSPPPSSPPPLPSPLPPVTSSSQPAAAATASVSPPAEASPAVGTLHSSPVLNPADVGPALGQTLLENLAASPDSPLKVSPGPTESQPPGEGVGLGGMVALEDPRKKLKEFVIPDSNSTTLPTEALALMKAAFDELDLDGSGELSFTELVEYATLCGKELSVDIAKSVDRAKVGFLSFIDLITLWYPKLENLTEVKQRVTMLPPSSETRQNKQKELMRKQRQVEDAEFHRRMAALMEKDPAEREKLWQDAVLNKRRSEALVIDDQRHLRWQEYCQTWKLDHKAIPPPTPIAIGPITLFPEEFYLDGFLLRPETRVIAVELLRALDFSSVNVSHFLKEDIAHLYLPHRYTKRAKVFRDYLLCPPLPPTHHPWKGLQHVHIKTNISLHSDVMYRFLVEGFNYGVGAPVHSDIVGHTHRRWNKLGAMEVYGWPAGWDANISNDYAMGAHISQYFSKDEFVVIKLSASSIIGLGFSVTAFLLHHDFGASFNITSTIVASAEDL